MMVVLFEGHPSSKNSVLTLEEVKDESIILCDNGFERPTIELFEENGLHLNIHRVVDSVNTALRMTRERKRYYHR